MSLSTTKFTMSCSTSVPDKHFTYHFCEQVQIHESTNLQEFQRVPRRIRIDPGSGGFVSALVLSSALRQKESFLSDEELGSKCHTTTILFHSGLTDEEYRRRKKRKKQPPETYAKSNKLRPARTSLPMKSVLLVYCCLRGVTATTG